eukprot:TRINITY_DN12660_c0_g3_i2.p1 TRINITY_DN12660_c0_g3~~TRINITY_DN12660_c0_g3_i2.p1  ORF type:complete len:515 (+),score=117.86 TRINITY_DN12660_c0_g3_i2:52-1545(+)
MTALYWMLGCFLAFLYLIKARPVPGVLLSSECHWFFGSSLLVVKILTGREKLGTNELAVKEFHKNGWRAIAWAHIGGRKGVTIADPRDIQYVLKDNFLAFEKRLDMLEELLGDGIFVANGESWKTQRTTAAHMFNRRALREKMSSVFGAHAQDLVKLLATQSQVDVQRLFYCFTFDCTNSIMFSRTVNSLGGDKKDLEFQRHFDVVQTTVPQRFGIAWWKINRMFQLSAAERAIKHSTAKIDEYIGEIIDTYVTDDGEVAEGVEDDQTMTGLYVARAKETGDKVTKKYLRDMIMNYAIAGRDTTASALTACVQFLVEEENAHWQGKLREEALRCFGAHRDEPLTFDDIEDRSPLSEAVFLEALRLQPAVPRNSKRVLQHVTLPSGVPIPPGANLSWVPYATNRHPDYWGPDAATFSPTRWLDGKAKDYSDYVYSTFNAGPRLCLGKSMAILEGKIALLTMFASLRFSKVDGFVPRSALSITFQLTNGLLVNVHKVEE